MRSRGSRCSRWPSPLGRLRRFPKMAPGPTRYESSSRPWRTGPSWRGRCLDALTVLATWRCRWVTKLSTRLRRWETIPPKEPRPAGAPTAPVRTAERSRASSTCAVRASARSLAPARCEGNVTHRHPPASDTAMQFAADFRPWASSTTSGAATNRHAGSTRRTTAPMQLPPPPRAERFARTSGPPAVWSGAKATSTPSLIFPILP